MRPLDSSTARSASVVAVLYVAYLWCTWSFIGIWWGDYGLWMHEVDRFASGQVPYRDFSWEYPPLALATYAMAARWFGSVVPVLLTVSAVICLGIFITYFALAHALVDRALLTITVAGTLLTSVAYSSIESETLASGMYTPAAPLGGLLILLGAFLCLRLMARVRFGTAVALGVVLALAVLTKQDFWIPSTCVLAFAAARLWRAGHPAGVATLAVIFAGVLAAGIGITVRAAGWENVLAGVTGYSAASEEAGRMLPSWERSVGQLVLFAGFSLVVALCLSVGGVASTRNLRKITIALGVVLVALVSVYVMGTLAHVAPMVGADPNTPVRDPTMRFFVGAPPEWPGLVRRALILLGHRLRVIAWPLLFAPVALVWILTRWRSFSDHRLRDVSVFLLCLAIAARGRRQFEHIDWHNFLFEVPTMLLVLKLLFPGQPAAVLRASRVFVSIILVGGAASFVDWTLSPALGLPSLAQPAWGRPTPVVTARGVVRLPERDAAAYARLVGLMNSIDPSGAAPVFAVGNQGPWAYFTGRRNPTPLTYGFSWSNQDPERVIRNLLSEEPKPIIIEEAIYRRRVYGFPELRIAFNRWELIYQENYHTRVDRPLYERILAHYELVGTVDGRLRRWSVYRWKGP